MLKTQLITLKVTVIQLSVEFFTFCPSQVIIDIYRPVVGYLSSQRRNQFPVVFQETRSFFYLQGQYSPPPFMKAAYFCSKLFRSCRYREWFYCIKKSAQRAPQESLCILLPVFCNSAPRFCKAVVFFTAFCFAAVPAVNAKKGWITLPPRYFNPSVRDFYRLLIEHAESIKCFFCVFSGSHDILSFPL